MKRIVLLCANIALVFFSIAINAATQSIEITPCEFNEGLSIGLSPPDFFNIYHRTGQMPILAVTSSNFPSGFEAEFAGWRARPNDSELGYTIFDPTPQLFIPTSAGIPLLPSTNSRLLELDPSHPLSFFASARYVFGNTHRDLKLSFFQVDEDVKKHNTVLPGQTLWNILEATPVRPPFFAGPFLISTDVDAKTSYNFHLLNLDMGHHIYSLRPVDFRVFVGASAATVTKNMNVSYQNVSGFLTGTVPFSPLRMTVTEDSNFKGLGPRVGASGTVEFCSGFGLVAEIADELLIGNNNSKYLCELFDSRDVLLDGTTINPNSEPSVVPAIDGKLALRYSLALNPSFKIGLEAGYKIIHFFNPITSYRYTADPNGFGFGGVTFTKIVNDASLEGAYLAVNFEGFSSCGDLCPPFPVTVPSLPGGFEIGIGIDYLRPYNDQFDYAILDAGPIPSVGTSPSIPIHPSLNSILEFVEPNYNAGIHAHIGYAFSFSPYDVTLDYLNVNTSNSVQILAPTNGGIWPITSLIANEFEQAVAPALASQANATASAYEHLGNLEIGKHIFADSLKLRLFGGVEAAQVQNQLKATYNITTLFLNTGAVTPNGIDNPTEIVTQTTKYSGVGPRIGFDADYFITPYFAIVSHFGAAFLYGKFDSTITDQGLSIFVNEDPDVVFAPTSGTSSSETSHIVPTLDEKVGLAFDMCLFAGSHSTLEIGYQFNHYFRASQNFRHANPVSGIFVRELNDLTFEGPYLDLTFYGLSFCPPVCDIPPPSVGTVPEFFGGIEIGLKYLYFNPHAGNFPYAISDPTPVVIPGAFLPLVFPVEELVSVNSTVQAVDPRFESGYGLHLGYQIPCTGNDISLNYEYFTSDDTSSIQATPGGVIWPQLLFEVVPYEGGGTSSTLSFPTIATEASESVSFRYNYANLEFARHHMLRCVDLRLGTGLGYTNIGEDLHAIYLNGFTETVNGDGSPQFVPQTDVFINTIFSGIGPRVAATARYVSPYIIGFRGTAATDLLIGKLRSRYVASTSNGLSTAINPDGHVYVVPKLGLDLALTFDSTFACFHRVTLELGYEINHYFNATNSYQYTSGMIPAHVKGERDVSFDGPYVLFQVMI